MKKASILSQREAGGMSHPEEMTKLGWTVHSSSRARVALRMDSGVPLQNSPAGSMLPMTREVSGRFSSASYMEMALPM